MIKVSVIIPTYNEEKYIEECLNSLKRQTYKNFEVLVVDDGSTDKTRDIVKNFKKVKLIEGRHKGPGFSRNLGAKFANGEILVFVDADMTFDKDYIKNLIEPILKDKTKKIIGTTHDFEIAINTNNTWAKCWGKTRINRDDAKNVNIFRAIRKDKFLEMGGFDPKYSYADDQTFWYKYGIKPVVAKNTTCYHRNPETLKETFKQAKWIGESWKERFWIFRIPLLNYIVTILWLIIVPFAAFLKALKFDRETKKIKFSERLRFYLYKFMGYAVGIFKKVCNTKIFN